MDCTTETDRKFIRKTLEFLLLVCIFSSLLYSYLYSGVPYGLLLFSFFARALDRKYMFLVCNGILAFIAKNSTRGGGGKITELPPVLEESATVCGNVLMENQEEEDDGVVMDKEFEDGEDGKGVIEVDVTLSAEELNKKCEEFIRKMKDEIRIEAQQQVIAL